MKKFSKVPSAQSQSNESAVSSAPIFGKSSGTFVRNFYVIFQHSTKLYLNQRKSRKLPIFNAAQHNRRNDDKDDVVDSFVIVDLLAYISNLAITASIVLVHLQRCQVVYQLLSLFTFIREVLNGNEQVTIRVWILNGRQTCSGKSIWGTSLLFRQRN